MTNPKMPELPEPSILYFGNGAIIYFTEENMRAHGQACWGAARVVDEVMAIRYLDADWADSCMDWRDSHFITPEEFIKRTMAALQAALGGDGE